MKLLSFVDVHGSLKAISRIKKLAKKKKPDLMLCAGDLSIFENHLSFLVHDLDRIGIKTLVVPGNHEGEKDLKAICSMFENVEYFHKKHQRIGDFLLLGYGGGGFAERDKKFEKWVQKLKIRKNDKIILIVHGPPFGTKLDLLGDHSGNRSYRKFIKLYKPVLVVCGHFHENHRKEDKVGKTLIINPGPYGRIDDL